MGKMITAEGMTEKFPGTTKGYWAQLRFHGNGPEFFKPTPRVVLYDEESAEAWVRSSVRTQTGDAA